MRMKRIATGQNTAQFNRATAKIKTQKEVSFSLFYGSADGRCLHANANGFKQ
jgi:hypothetical protein